ncbi:Flp pilus assembly complex ATPase component TadA [Cupriavidus sp. AU9028]|nr:ATPase, T2SS/T4P/T4SS family [Cupriavidus sp. AU9028]MBY4897438.1 Flp pilus assembly complex ATPase component TadA [Cupriavidus sp. AU9028]
MLDGWLNEAVSLGASDLHFEPYPAFYRIRVRIDGVLHELARPPLVLREAIAARLKVLARLDIAEKRLPQDGRLQLRAGGPVPRVVDCRLSTLPTLAGEKVVVRLLPDASQVPALDAVGFEPEQLAAVLHALGRPHGMVLITGPTGSGKTVSLYSLLARLDDGSRNLCTVEDPAEIALPGINQVNLNERAGMTFCNVLPALLRQDPDVLLVGEIRDAATAAIAVRAAQTGHLLLSTLHTNDAPAALVRLADLGVPRWQTASTVHLITAQRLVRRLCQCRLPDMRTASAMAQAGVGDDALSDDRPLWRPGGCASCRQTGYRGRCAVHQVVPVSEAMRELMRVNAGAARLAEQARREGVLSLREAGLRKVRAGLTSLDEVLAATAP